MSEETKQPTPEEVEEAQAGSAPAEETVLEETAEKTEKKAKKKKEKGYTFTREQVEQMELAAKQLSETDYRVIDVAENCGFHNHSYFTRVFRKKYNKTPLAYRRTTRSGGE